MWVVLRDGRVETFKSDPDHCLSVRATVVAAGPLVCLADVLNKAVLLLSSKRTAGV